MNACTLARTSCSSTHSAAVLLAATQTSLVYKVGWVYPLFGANLDTLRKTVAGAIE